MLKHFLSMFSVGYRHHTFSILLYSRFEKNRNASSVQSNCATKHNFVSKMGIYIPNSRIYIDLTIFTLYCSQNPRKLQMKSNGNEKIKYFNKKVLINTSYSIISQPKLFFNKILFCSEFRDMTIEIFGYVLKINVILLLAASH